MFGAAKLLKIRKYDVDQQRLHVGRLRGRRAALAEEIDALLEQVRREAEIAAGESAFEARRSFPAFRERAEKREDSLRGELARVDAELESETERLNELFAELKKTEAIAEARRLAEERERARKEQQELDEIGVERNRRKAKQDAES